MTVLRWGSRCTVASSKNLLVPPGSSAKSGASKPSGPAASVSGRWARFANDQVPVGGSCAAKVNDCPPIEYWSPSAGGCVPKETVTR